MRKIIFTSLLICSFLVISDANAGLRERTVQDYITGTAAKKAVFDRMFGSDVQIVNHYLSWRSDDRNYSINIENLQNFFNFYHLKARKEMCDNDWVPSGVTEDINARIPQNFINSMKSRFQYPAHLYPHLERLDPLKKAELAIFEMCQFGYLSYMTMPFDPAGIGGLNRNFEFDNAIEKTREICLPITKQILTDELNRDFTLLTMPENIQEHRLCRTPGGSNAEFELEEDLQGGTGNSQ